jgi:hypothetical protein
MRANPKMAGYNEYMRKTIFTFIVISLIATNQAFAQTQGQVGFIQGNIWFSQSLFFFGDNVRIYSAILNSEEEDVIGTVQFFDNGILIGSSQFQAAKGASLEQVWIDWRATEGKHNIYAEISDLKLSLPGGKTTDIEPSNTKSGQVDLDIDIDTDGDNIGNKEDQDDDNDGLTDAEEKDRGTDPLLADTDSDGLSDKEELDAQTNPLDEDSDNDGIKDSQDSDPSSNAAAEAENVGGEPIQEKAIEIAKKSAGGTKNLIDRFANYERQGLSDQKTKISRNLELIRGTATPKNEEEETFVEENRNNKNKGVFLRSYLLLLAILEALFSYKPILYILLLLIAYKIIHWAIRATKRRSRGYDHRDEY